MLLSVFSLISLHVMCCSSVSATEAGQLRGATESTPIPYPRQSLNSPEMCGNGQPCTTDNMVSAGTSESLGQFFGNLFDTSSFPPRWRCGTWSPLHGWIHVCSDVAIFAAYMAIPIVLLYFLRQRADLPFPSTLWLFAAFIALCGTGHLIEAIIFWHPVYRFAGLVKCLTAAVSCATVVALIPLVPKVLALRSPKELEAANTKLKTEMAERQRAEADREKLHAELMVASRQAGMAEIASGVLHNIGNVLNSVNISVHVLIEQINANRSEDLALAAALLDEHHGELAEFFTQDERGRRLPEYLRRLAEAMCRENAQLMEEAASLERNLEHINQIVNMQQSFAQSSSVQETVELATLVEDAVRFNESGLLRHAVTVFREYEETPPIVTDKHQIVQILVNLIKNAKQAVSITGNSEQWVRLRVRRNGSQSVAVEVTDNGIGISAEHLPKLFTHGFTTKKDGHGFGLHSGAIAAKELGGRLSAHSDGPGCGATFTLELPITVDERRRVVTDDQQYITSQVEA